jgi:hypothetical protein
VANAATMSALMKHGFYAQYAPTMVALALHEAQLAAAAGVAPLVGPLVASARLPGDDDHPDSHDEQAPLQVRTR